MRYDVKKILVIGAEDQRAAFFEKAQSYGIIDFIDVSRTKMKEIPKEIHDITNAIKILRGLPTVHQEQLEDSKADAIIKEILDYKKEAIRLEEDLRLLELEISRVAPFGDFSLKDIDYIEKEGHRSIRFYSAKSGAIAHDAQDSPLLYIHSEHGLDYFISISEEQVKMDKLVESHITEPVGQVLHRYREEERSLHKIEKTLKSFAKYNHYLHAVLVTKLNQYHLYAAQNSVKQNVDGLIFAAEGWVPTHKMGLLPELTKELSVHYEEIAIEPQDVIPTYLENKGVGKVGEDLVHIYDTPSATDKDPSWWVLSAFALFFAMIIGDAGYGVVFLGLAAYIHYRLPKLKGLGKRVLKLFFILSLACIFWGIQTGSFFGMTLSLDNPMRKVSLLQWLVEKKAAYHMAQKDEVYNHIIQKFPKMTDAKTPIEFIRGSEEVVHGQKTYEVIDNFSRDILFELALFVGVCHLILSFGRYLDRNLSGIGWIAFLVGAYLYFPYFLGATSLIYFVFGIPKELGGQIGLYMIYGGIAVSVLLSIIKHKLLGVLEVMLVVQIFADVMSYLRLYALGLSGAILAATVNEIAATLPLFFAVIVLFISHCVNMLLGTMAGVIHGLRLNFLEWYHYSFEGQGRPFRPLRLLDEDND